MISKQRIDIFLVCEEDWDSLVFILTFSKKHLRVKRQLKHKLNSMKKILILLLCISTAYGQNSKDVKFSLVAFSSLHNGIGEKHKPSRNRIYIYKEDGENYLGMISSSNHNNQITGKIFNLKHTAIPETSTKYGRIEMEFDWIHSDVNNKNVYHNKVTLRIFLKPDVSEFTMLIQDINSSDFEILEGYEF